MMMMMILYDIFFLQIVDAKKNFHHCHITEIVHVSERWTEFSMTE